MKYLFYLLPGLLNVVIGMFFFITAKRLADAGASSLAVTATMPMWAFIYAVCSYAVGKIATRDNAVKILLISQFILLGAMVGMLVSPGLKLQYFWLLLSGIGTGLFFSPFQGVVKLFEKVELSPETFARSSAIYTFSWSIGQGLGPLTAGIVWGAFDPNSGWQYCYVINICIVAAVIISLLMMHRFIKRRISDEAQRSAAVPTADTPQLTWQVPDIMPAIWVLALGGFLTLSVLRSYLPDFATKTMQLPTTAQGIMLSLISVVQAVVALSCLRSRAWQFKPWVGGAAVLLACSALIMLTVNSTLFCAWGAAALFGCFSGVLCYNMAYHALANAHCSARYAAINETIVGGMSVFAPLGAGFLADKTSPEMPFYLLTAALLLAGAGFCKLTWKHRNYLKN